jgi:hypothetical protein
MRPGKKLATKAGALRSLTASMSIDALIASRNGSKMSKIDWSKAGKRIRWTPRNANDPHNPDWHWTQKRWKDEADYAADAMPTWQIVAMVPCARCGSIAGQRCRTERGEFMPDSAHEARRRAAGEQKVAEDAASATRPGTDPGRAG